MEYTETMLESCMAALYSQTGGVGLKSKLLVGDYIDRPPELVFLDSFTHLLITGYLSLW